MSDPTPERTVPGDFERLITALNAWAYEAGFFAAQDKLDDETIVSRENAKQELRQAILAALEPDREVRERMERLRLLVLRCGPETREGAVAIGYIQPGDLADDLLTATSSAHEGRE